MVSSFKFIGLLIGRQRTSIDDDDPASWVKRMEHVIQNGSGMHEFVVSIGNEDGWMRRTPATFGAKKSRSWSFHNFDQKTIHPGQPQFTLPAGEAAFIT